MRRVSSIALVHDALSMSVDEEVNLDQVVDRILPMMNDVATVDTPIRISRFGDLGVLDADRATALVMVITELVQNAIEHAFDGATQVGCVTIRAERSARWLDVVVHDDGRGLPTDSAWRRPTGWACRSCGRWSRPNWTARWACTPRPPVAPTWCCGCRSAGVRGWRSSGPIAQNVGRRRNCRQIAFAQSYGPAIFVGAVCGYVVVRLDAAAGLRAGVAPLQCAPLVFTHATPHAGVLARIQRPGEAFSRHRAAITHELRVSDLRECRAAVSHREEQFRILVATNRLVAPIHVV